jgi:hypothetical protein
LTINKQDNKQDNKPLTNKQQSNNNQITTTKEDNNYKEVKETINIDSRKQKFASTLKPFLVTYGKEMLNEFYNYWTEPNKSNTKFRQELEKSWGLKRRLETWSKNDKNFKPNNQQPKKLGI